MDEFFYFEKHQPVRGNRNAAGEASKNALGIICRNDHRDTNHAVPQ
jgi:hypothetical protein